MSKNLILILLSSIFLFAIHSCTTELEDTDPITDPNPDPVIVDSIIQQPTETVELRGEITNNMTLFATKYYLLKGFVYVKSGVTLTIEPGTIIKGDKDSKATLIVLKGAKIIAEGTAKRPIVFTSNQQKGSRSYGDWGGLILLGESPTNKPADKSVIEGEGNSLYGGAKTTDNSGILKYVRIEFGGIAFNTDNEINGLTLGGVGSGTILDYIQVSKCGDDAFEFFGGTANASHLVSYANLDDDLDVDNGYSGKLQHIYVLRDPMVADQSGNSNGIEADNDATGSDATPATNPTIANMTVIMGGGNVNKKYQSGMLLRRNSAVSVYNSLFVGAYRNGLELKDAKTIARYTNGEVAYQGLVFVDAAKMLVGADVNKFTQTSNKNTTASLSQIALGDNYNHLLSPSILPSPNSILLSGFVSTPSGLNTANYVGAFGTENWMKSWTNFDPNNTEY